MESDLKSQLETTGESNGRRIRGGSIWYQRAEAGLWTGLWHRHLACDLLGPSWAFGNVPDLSTYSVGNILVIQENPFVTPTTGNTTPDQTDDRAAGGFINLISLD